MVNEWLPKRLYTLGNLVKTANILYQLGKYELCISILELIYYVAQTILDENCIEEADGNNPS